MQDQLRGAESDWENRRKGEKGVKTRRLALMTGVLLVLSATAGVVGASSASAVPSVGITSSATIPIGSQREIGAIWGDAGPYKVNFTCGISGCANYVTNSTTTTTVVRSVYYGVCGSGYTANHSVDAWMNAGSGTHLSAKSFTRWSGSACKQLAPLNG